MITFRHPGEIVDLERDWKNRIRFDQLNSILRDDPRYSSELTALRRGAREIALWDGREIDPRDLDLIKEDIKARYGLAVLPGGIRRLMASIGSEREIVEPETDEWPSWRRRRRAG